MGIINVFQVKNVLVLNFLQKYHILDFVKIFENNLISEYLIIKEVTSLHG